MFVLVGSLVYSRFKEFAWDEIRMTLFTFYYLIFFYFSICNHCKHYIIKFGIEGGEYMRDLCILSTLL